MAAFATAVSGKTADATEDALIGMNAAPKISPNDARRVVSRSSVQLRTAVVLRPPRQLLILLVVETQLLPAGDNNVVDVAVKLNTFHGSS